MAKSLSVRRLSAALIAAATAAATAVLVPLTASAAPDPVPPVNTLVDTIDLGDGVESFVLAPDGATAYFSTYPGADLMVLDVASSTVSIVDVPESLGGPIAVSPDSERVYLAVSSDSQPSVREFDAGTGTIVGTAVELGAYPSSLVVSPNGSRLFAVEGGEPDSQIEVIDTATMTVTQSFTLGPRTHNAVVSPDGGTLYAAVHDDDELAVIDLDTSAITTIPVDDRPGSLAMSPDGAHVYVSNFGSAGAVAMIDTADNSIGYLGAGRSSTVLALSPDGETLYLGYQSDRELVTLQIGTGAIGTVDLGSVYPGSIAVSPDSTTVYVVRPLGIDVKVLEYVAPPVTVTFDANGGTGTMAAQLADEGETVALDANGFTAPPGGLVFAGWNTAADGTGTAYLDGADFTFTADTTLYAQWLDIESMAIVGWSSAVEGELVTYTVEGYGPGGTYLGDVTPLVTLTSDLASDVISGGNVTFGFDPHAIGGSRNRQLTATLIGDADVTADLWVIVDSAAASIEVDVPATASQGDTITVAVRALDASGDVLGDASAVAVITSDVETDVVNGLQVTFTHASPHTITAVITQEPDFTAQAVVEVAPAADGELSATGADPRPAIGAVTLLLIGGGIMILIDRRRRLVS